MKIAWELSGEREERYIDKSERYVLASGRDWVPKSYIEGGTGEKKISWGKLIEDVDSIIQRVPVIAYENENEIVLQETRINSFSRKSDFPNSIELVFEPRPFYAEPDLEPGIVRLCSFRSRKDSVEAYFRAATSAERFDVLGARILL